MEKANQLQTIVIPKSFTIANTEITVNEKDFASGRVDSDRAYYGEWFDPKNEITIYSSITLETGEVVNLTGEQKENTFVHELMHCFMFFAGMEQDERLAQTFANFVREYFATVKY